MPNQYESLKPTNIESIGNIPINWDFIKLKFFSDIYGRIGFRGYTASDLVDDGEGAITLGPPNIENQKLNLKEKKFLSWEKYDESPEIKIYNGDLLLVKTASVGKVALVENLNYPTTINPQLTVFKNININNKYFYYAMISDVIQHQIASNTNGGVIFTLSQENIQNYTIPLPSNEEQKQIANYLDKKTAKIDTTIAKNEELIQLLEEKRVALINQVVTKGLNPDVPMKDSGVEWIGEIPEHWEIRKFGHMADKIVVGYVGSIGESYTDESGIPLIKTENIQNGKLNLNKLSYVTKEFHLKNKKSQIKSGDILIARHGESGRSCVVPKSLTIANSLNIVILQSGKDMNGYYYSYLLNSSLIQEFMQSIQGGAVQGVVNTEDIAFLKVHVPPKIEQNHIVDFLNQKTSKIDKTISKIQENINLLDEYKTSLIHHVVTGKIDVRGEEI